MIKIPKKPVNLKKFFSDLGLNIINNAVVSKTKTSKGSKINEKSISTRFVRFVLSL